MSHDPNPPVGPPESISRALTMIWVAIGLTVLSGLLSLANLDEAVEVALEADTTGTLTEDSVRTGALVVTVLFLAIGVGVYALLALAIRRGRSWARLVFTVLAVLFVMVGVLGLSAQQGVATAALSVVRVLVLGAALWFLWRPESSAWLTRRRAEPAG